MNIYPRLVSSFYPVFLQQFNQKITKLATKIGINTKNNIIFFESVVTCEPKTKHRTLSFLLNYQCQLYEVSYLGIPLSFKLKPVRFFNNLQLIIFELPITPTDALKINVTFKYYCTQNEYVSFNDCLFMLNDQNGLFPHVPTNDQYTVEAILNTPKNWNLITGCKEQKKVAKFNGQTVSISGDSNGLSIIGGTLTRSTDYIRDLEINLLYPEQYFDEVKLITALTKEIVEFYLTSLGAFKSGIINVAIVDGNFEAYFDGSNMVFSCGRLDSVKTFKESPAAIKEKLYRELSKLISKLWWTQVNVEHPDDQWLVNGFCDYTALLCYKEEYGEDAFNNLITQLQWLYLKSPGLEERISIRSAAYGLGNNIDKVYPLNILLVHLLNFNLDDRGFFKLCGEITKWDSLNWERMEVYVDNKKGQWIRDHYVLKHKELNPVLTRIDYEQGMLKVSLSDSSSIWVHPVELGLVYDDRTNIIPWDGNSAISVGRNLKSIIIDPNLYIPGNVGDKIYTVQGEDTTAQSVQLNLLVQTQQLACASLGFCS